jgi:hypothetical protein
MVGVPNDASRVSSYQRNVRATASHVLHTSADPSMISREFGTSSSDRNALNFRGERFDRAKT